MAKSNQMSWEQEQRLKDEYARRNPPPAPPQEYRQPPLEASKVIEGGSSERLFVETNARRADYAHEARIRLVVVLGKENTAVELDSEDAALLIKELVRMRDGLDTINNARQAHLQARKEYEEAQRTYDRQRQNAIKRLMTVINPAQVDDDEALKRIQF